MNILNQMNGNENAMLFFVEITGGVSIVVLRLLKYIIKDMQKGI